MNRTLATRKEFLRITKHIAITDINWLIESSRTPNGHETPWSKRIVNAVLNRHMGAMI